MKYVMPSNLGALQNKCFCIKCKINAFVINNQSIQFQSAVWHVKKNYVIHANVKLV